MFTTPRQVRIIKCAIMTPGLELRGGCPDDKAQLENYGFDVLPFVQKIDIYESIFDNTLAGSITLLENAGLTEYIPMVGVETLGLVFQIEDNHGEPRTFARAFRIVAVKDMSFPRHNFRLYTLQLVTHEFVKSMSSRICRAFKTTCEEAVKSILITDLDLKEKPGPGEVKLLTDQPTYGKVNVVIPSYTPLQAINYFATLAQTVKEPRESNFLFFETLEGFHFTSVQSLIERGRPDKITGLNATGSKIKTFNVVPGQVSVAPTVDVDTLSNAIVRVHQPQTFDLLFDIAHGTLRSRMVTFDFLARKVSKDKEGDSRYTESFDKTTHLDQFPVYPQNFDLTVSNNVRIFTVPTNLMSTQSKYIKSNDVMDEQRMHEAVVLRTRQLSEIQHLQTLLELPGQPDLRAGMVVMVNYPSSPLLEGQEDRTINQSAASQPTPYYSGPHLVTGVHHIMTVKGPGSFEYRMDVRVTKDSLASRLYGTTDTTGA
jgi:hypothetical protein